MRESATNRSPLPVLVMACVGVMLLSSGCRDRTDAEIGTEQTPVVLVLSDATVRGKEAQVEVLRETLQRNSGLHMRVEVAPTAVRAIQMFGGQRADVGLLAPFEFLLARKLHDVEPALQVLRQGPTFRGAILVRADSDMSGLDDLAGKRIAYTDPYSMSGFVLPAARFSRQGIDVDSIFAGSHDEAVAMLEQGRVHAAATYQRRGVGEVAQRGLRVLELTDEVANEPVFFRQGLEEDKRQAIVKAFHGAVMDEQCRPAIFDLLGIDGFAPVDDDTYAELELLAHQAGLEVQSLVPGGWFVFHTNKEPFVTAP